MTHFDSSPGSLAVLHHHLIKDHPVMAITSSRPSPDYRTAGLDQVEVIMAAVRKTGTRFARWFKDFRDTSRPPFRWYEYGIYNH